MAKMLLNVLSCCLFNHNNINVPVSLFFQLVSKEKWNAFKEHLKLTR